MTISPEAKRDIQSLYAQSTDEYLRHIQEKAGSKRIFTQAELENFNIGQILESAQTSNKKAGNPEAPELDDVDFSESLDAIADRLNSKTTNYPGLADALIAGVGSYLMTQASKDKQSVLKKENAKRFIELSHKIFGEILKGKYKTYYKRRRVALFIIGLNLCGSSIEDAWIATANWIDAERRTVRNDYESIHISERKKIEADGIRDFIIKQEPELLGFIQEHKNVAFAKEPRKTFQAYEKLCLHLQARKKEREVIGIEDADLYRIPYLP